MRSKKPTITLSGRLITIPLMFAAICRLGGVDPASFGDPTAEGCKRALELLPPHRRRELAEEIEHGPAKGERKKLRLAARGY